MHSTTYRRIVKKIDAADAIEQRAKEVAKIGERYTAEDRKVAEELEARELFSAFLAEEI